MRLDRWRAWAKSCNMQLSVEQQFGYCKRLCRDTRMSLSESKREGAGQCWTVKRVIKWVTKDTGRRGCILESTEHWGVWTSPHRPWRVTEEFCFRFDNVVIRMLSRRYSTYDGEEMWMYLGAGLPNWRPFFCSRWDYISLGQAFKIEGAEGKLQGLQEQGALSSCFHTCSFLTRCVILLVKINFCSHCSLSSNHESKRIMYFFIHSRPEDISKN